MDPLRYPMPRLVLRRYLFPLDENLVTVLGTDVLSGVRGDDGHRKCSTGFAIGWRGRRLSVRPIEHACAVGNVINDRRNWMRMRLVVNAFLPDGVDYTKVLVFENDLIDIRIPLVRGWRALCHGG